MSKSNSNKINLTLDELAKKFVAQNAKMHFRNDYYCNDIYCGCGFRKNEFSINRKPTSTKYNVYTSYTFDGFKCNGVKIVKNGNLKNDHVRPHHIIVDTDDGILKLIDFANKNYFASAVTK